MTLRSFARMKPLFLKTLSKYTGRFAPEKLFQRSHAALAGTVLLIGAAATSFCQLDTVDTEADVVWNDDGPTAKEASSAPADHPIAVVAGDAEAPAAKSMAATQPQPPVVTGERTRVGAGQADQQRQAEVVLQQAAADFDLAMRMWNAEVAACQASPAAQYTPNQMGRFAAMGIQPVAQPQRQPNMALLQAARQAERRFLQAREQYQRLVGSN